MAFIATIKFTEQSQSNQEHPAFTKTFTVHFLSTRGRNAACGKRAVCKYNPLGEQLVK